MQVVKIAVTNFHYVSLLSSYRLLTWRDTLVLWRHLAERPEALAAHARRFLVLVQVGLEGEGLAAAAAHVRLFAGVRLDVGPQVGLVGEGLAALRTRERLLARVRADVTLQQPGSREALATVRACAALVVRAHVHAEGRHGDVDLLAVGTLAGLLVAVRPVSLAVSGQVGRRAVALAAVFAGVRLFRR